MNSRKIIQFIWDSGITVKEKEGEKYHIKMVLFMKEVGRMIKKMVKEDRFMLTEMSMRVIGLITRLKDLVF